METTVGPYINTKLSTVVELKANQMDNNIYKHLKSNLKRKVENKCFEKYGYISQVFEIELKSDGLIIPENLMASALYEIVFSCRLCNPIIKKNIICKIENINTGFIFLINGPIKVIVPIKEIEGTYFYYNKKTGNLLFNKNVNKPIDIISGSYVKVNIISKRIENNETSIKTLGTLVDVANDEEIEKSFSEIYGSVENEYIDFDDYEKKNI